MPKDYLPGNDYGHVCPVCGDELQQTHKSTSTGHQTFFVCRKAIGEECFDPTTHEHFFPFGSYHREVVYYQQGDRRIYARLRR